MSDILEVENLTKKFGELTAVNDIKFSISPGKIYGLIGPNGAGKSTLFHLISGVLKPTSGSVYFDGKDITDHSVHEVAEMGLVRSFQDTRIFSELTVEENLRLMDPGGGAFVDDSLQRIGLSEHKDALADDLSFGQQKLLNLTQILLLDPDLILLDEPFAGVNPTMEKTILKIIRESTDTTYMIVEHDMSIIMENCDDIIVMNAGRKLTRGSPDHVKTSPKVIEAYFGEEVT